MLDVIQLGEKLAAALPAETARAVRRDLRSLGVQVVRIEALPEQLLFDVKWFVVEAGKPVQIILSNPDVMPHNLVVSQPGSLQEVATLGGGMPQPADPDAKPFVPNTPLVLHATRLLQSGDTERLGFTAPVVAGGVHLRVHVSRSLVADVRRDAGRPGPRSVGGQTHRADRPDDARRSRRSVARSRGQRRRWVPSTSRRAHVGATI